MQEEINGLRRGCKALRFVSMAGAALLNPRGEKVKQLKKLAAGNEKNTRPNHRGGKAE